MLSMCKELEWGFEDGDAFHPDTFFTTADEFKEKLGRLLTDEDHYKTCLQQQYYIVDKYFNQPWLRKYIQNHIEF
jgi:gluconate kinase